MKEVCKMANKNKKGITNGLAIEVDNFIKAKGVKKTFISKEIGITPSYLQSLLEKDNFTVDDANRILAAIDCQLDIKIIPKDQ